MPDYPRALEYFSKAASKGYAPAEEKLNVPTTSFATGTSSSTHLSSQNASSKLSSLRIKRQPAAERPTNDDDDDDFFLIQLVGSPEEDFLYSQQQPYQET